VQLSLSVNDARILGYLASVDNDVYNYVTGLQFTKNQLGYLICSPSFEFDVGKLPDLKGYSANFFIECFVEGIQRLSLTEKQYKGMQRHWKALGHGGGQSLAEVASKRREVKERVQRFQLLVDKLDGRIADKSLFEVADSSFYEFARGRYQLLEKLFISPDKRITGNAEREKALFKGILVLAEEGSYDYVKQHRHLAQDPDVMDLLVKLPDLHHKRYGRNNPSDFVNYVINLMIEDDPSAKPFLHITKEVFDNYIDGHDGFTPEKVRSLNWKSSAIKRAFVESDIEL